MRSSSLHTTIRARIVVYNVYQVSALMSTALYMAISRNIVRGACIQDTLSSRARLAEYERVSKDILHKIGSILTLRHVGVIRNRR